MDRAVDGGHAARAELLEDAVGAEAEAREAARAASRLEEPGGEREPLGERAIQPAQQRKARREQILEVGALEDPDGRCLERDDVGGAGLAGEEGHLADEVAREDPADGERCRVQAEADLEGARLEDEEAVARLAALHENGARGDSDLLEAAPDGDEVVGREVAEERDVAERVR